MSVRYSYNLWQRDPARGFAILEEVARQAVHGFLPNMLALESTFGLSVVIFFEHYQDQAILTQLQHIWRRIITSLLYIREGNSHQKGVIQAFLRERIFSFVSGMVFRLFRDAPANDILNAHELEAFFRVSAEERKLYRRLVHYMNISDVYTREQMRHDYFQAIKKSNLLFIVVTEVGLLARSCDAPLSFLPFVRELFDEAKSDQAAYVYLGQITYVLENILNRSILSGDPVSDEIFKFFVEAVETSQEYYIRHPASLPYPASEAPQTLLLGPYILHYHCKTGVVKTPLLEMRIRDALASGNLPFFNNLTTTELNFIAILWHRPHIALEVLELFLNSGHPKIDAMIQAFLSRLKVRYPDEVDDFLEAQHVSDDFRLQVQTNEPVETLGELIGQNAWYFIRDEVILKSPELRSQLIQIFDKAADCKNLRAWLDYFIRQIINRVYGEEVLHQSAE